MVVLVLLIRILSVWPALAGLAVTVAIIPATMIMGKVLAGVRRASMQAADARVKLTTEVITGACVSYVLCIFFLAHACSLSALSLVGGSAWA